MSDRNQAILYSGGHKGAEAEFGRCAEKWGVRQVTLSYEGHVMEFSKDVEVLPASELLKGDAGDMYADLSEAVDSRKAQDVQAEYDRLVKAGRTPTSVKSKLTELAKPEYLAGSDADKQQLADVLLALTDADGKALYTEKTFAQWEKAAEKAAQAKPPRR